MININVRQTTYNERATERPVESWSFMCYFTKPPGLGFSMVNVAPTGTFLFCYDDLRECNKMQQIGMPFCENTSGTCNFDELYNSD